MHPGVDTRIRQAIAGHPLPAAIVDLDALASNAQTLLQAMGSAPVGLRIASKSIRVPALLRTLLQLGAGRFTGLLTYSAHESALLAAQGFDDMLVAYPFTGPDEAEALAQIPGAIATVDHPDQLPVLSAAAQAAGQTLRLCIDVDLSWRPFGGALGHFGVRRSPIRGASQAVALADAIAASPGLKLHALLAYEAQIAGVRDVNPGSRALDPVRAMIKRRSRPLALQRREQVVEALRSAGHALALVNGGGTGSIGFTAADPVVTEVTAGSGFLCPHLFSGYHGLPLRPAAYFALRVVRSSDPDHITCTGGGYIASGAPGADRLPQVITPNLVPVALEGFGEVQTPLRWTGRGPPPALGSSVLFSHAKSGELMERFDRVLLLAGDRVVDEVLTYRGLGLTSF